MMRAIVPSREARQIERTFISRLAVDPRREYRGGIDSLVPQWNHFGTNDATCY
jgi:hypothetical protein